jgi:hypothetical protein
MGTRGPGSAPTRQRPAIRTHNLIGQPCPLAASQTATDSP